MVMEQREVSSNREHPTSGAPHTIALVNLVVYSFAFTSVIGSGYLTLKDGSVQVGLFTKVLKDAVDSDNSALVHLRAAQAIASFSLVVYAASFASCIVDCVRCMVTGRSVWYYRFTSLLLIGTWVLQLTLFTRSIEDDGTVGSAKLKDSCDLGWGFWLLVAASLFASLLSVYATTERSKRDGYAQVPLEEEVRTCACDHEMPLGKEIEDPVEEQAEEPVEEAVEEASAATEDDQAPEAPVSNALATLVVYSMTLLAVVGEAYLSPDEGDAAVGLFTKSLKITVDSDDAVLAHLRATQVMGALSLVAYAGTFASCISSCVEHKATKSFGRYYRYTTLLLIITCVLELTLYMRPIGSDPSTKLEDSSSLGWGFWMLAVVTLFAGLLSLAAWVSASVSVPEGSPELLEGEANEGASGDLIGGLTRVGLEPSGDSEPLSDSAQPASAAPRTVALATVVVYSIAFAGIVGDGYIISKENSDVQVGLFTKGLEDAVGHGAPLSHLRATQVFAGLALVAYAAALVSCVVDCINREVTERSHWCYGGATVLLTLTWVLEVTLFTRSISLGDYYASVKLEDAFNLNWGFATLVTASVVTVLLWFLVFGSITRPTGGGAQQTEQRGHASGPFVQQRQQLVYMQQPGQPVQLYELVSVPVQHIHVQPAASVQLAAPAQPAARPPVESAPVYDEQREVVDTATSSLMHPQPARSEDMNSV